ncbi:MAG: vitamin B12 transport system substrate-binding protein [Bermanella sp.]|jgi:vitamin B12 transport system substrate-binding protein
MFKICILLVTFLTSLNSFSFEVPDVKNAQRIVALSPHSVELLYALGIGDRIVATTDYADYPDAAKKIERVGGYHGVLAERILELNPDLIVAWEGGNKSGDLDKLESLGLPVYRTETKKLRDIADEITMLGSMTGTQNKAKSLVDIFYQDLDRLTEDNKNKKKISFFYQLWSAPIRTISVGSWINEMLTICGGSNIVNTPEVDYPQISLETVLLNEPQTIIIPSAHGHDNGVLSGLKWTDWPEIPAVKNNHIYRINGDILHRFSLRVIEAIEKICSTFDIVRDQK